ncbi:hypothetical protein BJF85_18310 [Saccharomonospora sp. CUA-673]|uniref:SRPBCC family protein n=1 Tax=Saccharomonospora sp. CUA-673 TaxID=1904969 RepID=UPI0009651032|nr:SRPBCC family protein [Saccharomonospora sp. CUA-673]OLT45927.1 hypothetical protein BJF85_18310 [Saccharomonospora sp. CUA-673]
MSTERDVSTEREFYAEVLIDAPPERVWAVLTDFRHLAAASPELLAMTPVKPGGLRRGQWYIGWNRRKVVVWPTRNVIDDVAAPSRLSWVTTTSGARWSFELLTEDGGTRLVQRRSVPRQLTAMGKLFAGLLLGGGAQHADELESSTEPTLAHLKRVAEAG